MGKSQLVEKVAMGAITLVLVLTALPQVDRYYRERRDDWRSVGQMLEYNLKPQDMVVLFNVVPYVGYYSRRAVQQVWPARSLADVQQAYAAGQPLWVLLTPYLEQIPEAKEIRDWIDRQPSLNFDFGLAMHLHYLHAGKTQSDLLQATKQFHLPDRPELWAAFGKALSTIEAKADAQRAFECAAKLVTDSHQEASYLFDAANMAYLQGKHSEALVLYDRVLALEPDHSDAHTLKASTLLAQGQLQQALDELTLVLTHFHMDDYWTHRFAGDALRLLDRPAEAADHYRRALELSPDAHDLRYHMGLLYAQMDRLDEAQAWWQDYLAHQPDGPLAPAAHEHLDRVSDN